MLWHLLNAKSKECLTAEFVGHASVPQSKIDKHLDFINANITSSEAIRPIFLKILLNAL